jgi:excisionase family DNA binding protein
MHVEEDHEETVREYLREGRIKAQKIGRTWIVQERDLRAFMAKPRKPGRPRKEDAK